MANLSVTLELDNRGYITGIKASEDAIKKFGQTSQTATDQAARGMNNAAVRSNTLFESLGRLRGVLVGAAFIGFARGAFQAAERIQGLSDAIGIAVPQLLQLQNALRVSGVEGENFNQVMIKFSQVVDDATERGSQAYEMFMKLGVSEKELQTLSIDKLFIRTTQALAELESKGISPTAKAIEAFGKKAGELVPQEVLDNLDLTVEEFIRLREEADGIEKANELMEKFKDTTAALQRVFVEVFSPMTEFVSNLLKDLPQLIILFRILLGIIIAIGVASGIRALVASIQFLVRGLQAIPSIWRNIRAAFSRGPFDNPRRNADVRDQAARGLAAAGGALTLGGLAANEVVGAFRDQPAGDQEQERATNRVITDSDKAQNAAERLASRLDNLRDKVADIAKSYAQYSSELRANNFLAEYNLGLSENEVEVNNAILDVRKQAGKAIQDYQTILQNLKADEMGLKPIIEEQIRIIRERALADETSVAQSVQAIQKYREQMEVLADQIEARNRALSTEESLQQLQDEINLVGLYGDALEDQQALLEVTQELRGKLLGIQQEENDLILKKDQLGAEAFQREMARLKALREEAYVYAEERLRLEEELIAKQRELNQDWQKELSKQLEDLADSISPAKFAADAFGSVIKNVDNALTQFVEKGKFSFKEFVRSILRDLALAMARMLVFRAILAAFGMAGFGPFAAAGSSGMALNYTGPQFGGFAANGGKVMPGKAYMVGERGPELFMPKSIGNVIPNNQLGGMAANQTQVTYNINAVDASSFRSLLARDPQYLFNVTEVGRRSSPARRLA